MRHLKALMLIVLTISVMLLALTSCETVENVVGQIPGIENILPHQHDFVEGKCECGETDPNYKPEPEVPEVLDPITIYLVGDSTVCSFTDGYYYPRYGYGTQLGNYLDEKATVINLALSGRSSKSFILP